MDGKTKPNNLLATKLHRIANQSSKNRKAEFGWLMPLFSKENLAQSFYELDGRKATGVDGITKDDYAQNLDKNIDSLLERMKSMSYRPSPVREVLIPKANGKMRPLGIPSLEDKIVQNLFSKILNSIYEPIFRKSSFGFRPNRNCHQAVKSAINSSFEDGISIVIDVDLENFFGSIDHQKLIALLGLKIKDKRFLRYVSRMLKAGILRNAELNESSVGTQGSLASPILANVFGHYAFDVWFEDEIIPNCRGRVKLVRYCDDMVILCESVDDSERIMKALEGRCTRFSLSMNREKTKTVSFSRRAFKNGERQGAFDFLGFTFYMGHSRKGLPIPKVKTSSKSFRAKLRNVDLWYRRNRDRAVLKEFWKIFCLKLQGHINYYSVSHNTGKVVDFVHKARRCFFKWINRRSQRRSMSWSKFLLFEKQFPPPRVLVKCSLF